LSRKCTICNTNEASWW